MGTKVQLPSVQIDRVREDLGDATQGTVLAGNAETYALADGMTLSVAVDGGGAQVVTFLAVNFDDIAEATAVEVAASITAGLTGATAEDDGGAVRITSDVYGATSSVQVTGGTANAVLGFPGSLEVGADFTPTVELINRIPEPGEYGVPLDSVLELELHDGDGAAPAGATVEVYVDGDLAFSAGSFQTGFDGPGSTTSNPDAATLRIVIDPTTDFASDAEVEVRVTESGSSLDETYAFRAEDLTSPRVVSAEARSQLVVRVTFNEEVRQVSPSGASDSLNPANYTFQRLAVPTVDVEAVEVTPVDDSTVDIEVDLELSFASPYLLTVSNVVDAYGNIVAAPYNSVEFQSLDRPWPDGRRFELLELLPQINRTEDATGELELWVACLQDVFDLLLKQVDDWTDILDPDLAPARYLDAMLADLGNPFTFAELSEIDKRRLLRVLVDIYREKGTEAGIIDVVRFFLGIDVTIEIYNGVGWELASSDSPTLDGQSPPAGPGDELSSDETEPADAAELGPGERRLLYSFEIVSPVALTDEERTRIVAIAELMKPAHTHLVRIVEPTTVEAIDHLELGLSELGETAGPSGNWTLH